MKSNDTKRKKKVGSTSRKRNRSVTKQLSRIMDDENTTNSEASEHAVFSDINWEDNLEIDTTSLLEEFAPQTLPKPLVKSKDKPVNSEPKADSSDLKEKTSEAVEFELCDVECPSEFHIGLKLLVLHYKTSQWVEGVVDEIDYEEEEVLVKYENNCDSPEEWLSMKSQRIKKKKSLQKSPVSDVEASPEEKPAKEKIILKEILSKPVKPVPEVVPEPSTAPPLKQSLRSKKKIAIKKIKRVIKKPTFKKTVALSSKSSQRRSLQLQDRKHNRRLPIWKSHLQQSSKGSTSNSSDLLSKCACKFSAGEKVLAKWSDHRMQKFPAIIGKACGNGYYDVLFYDGFEKTILEDNIYKTTEEEMAKYKESKPSEADSFIDVDLTSKHERRKKKRKTFDDFLEEKDFKRTKKMECFDLNHSESFQRASFSRNKSALQSFSVHTKRATTGSPKHSPVVSSPKASASSPNPPSTAGTKVQEQPPLKTTASDEGTSNTPILEPVKAPVPPTENKQVVPKVEEKKKITTVKSLPSFKYPLEITCHDGIVRKSILIEDNKLPSGWTKHVIAWVENVWACFLFTPDKYAVHSLIELKKYFRISESQDPPEGLDFSFPKDSLQDLIEGQKDLAPKADYRKWVNKILDERKVTKKVRILPPSRSMSAGGHFATKRVRTLLPRYRSHTFNQGTSSKTLEGKVWRCPKTDCAKKFRKENLLHMHIKHYHRDLSELAESAPKVVDLALARTSADGTFTTDVPPKRSLPKTPIFEPMPEKTSNSPSSEKVDNSLPEIKSGGSMTGASLPPSINNSSNVPNAQSPQPVTSSLKVLTPVKVKHHTKPRSESEPEPSDLGTELVEKPRIHNTPKTILKKPSEAKSSDDMAYLTGSRAFKKKQQPTEKPLSVETVCVGDPFLDDESKDDSGMLERLQSEEIINCICGFKEEDGLMVQCEICLCWQHGACHGMDHDSDVPERYVCTTCLDPLQVRSSQRYSYANHYLTLTKLPRFSHRTIKHEVLRHRERVLSKSFELTSNLQSIHRMERALTAKINIAEQSDHPKLYLWSTNWDSSKKKHTIPSHKKFSSDSSDKGRRGPVGEAPIESIDCRLRLLDRIEADQQDMESRLTIIQAQLQALESEDFEMGGEEREAGGGDPLLKQAVYMLLRDLSTIATATSLS